MVTISAFITSIVLILTVGVSALPALTDIKSTVEPSKKKYFTKIGYYYLLLNLSIIILSLVNQYVFHEEQKDLVQKVTNVNNRYEIALKHQASLSSQTQKQSDSIETYKELLKVTISKLQSVGLKTPDTANVLIKESISDKKKPISNPEKYLTSDQLPPVKRQTENMGEPDKETELDGCRTYPNARSEYFGTYAFINRTKYPLLLYAIVSEMNISPRKYSIAIPTESKGQVPKLYIGTTDNQANILNSTLAYKFYFRTISTPAYYGYLQLDVKACTITTRVLTDNNLYMTLDGAQYEFSRFDN